MSDQQVREWRFYAQDMLKFAEKVLTYTSGMDRATFEADELVYDATMRNLELIGEAARHIPAMVRETHAEVPWRMVVALRNQLIHGYLGLDKDTLWSVVRGDVPALLPVLRQMLAAPR